MQGNTIPEAEWRPNHFVAVLPLEPQRHDVQFVEDTSKPLRDIQYLAIIQHAKWPP
jgi:hypothetical protein